MRTLGEDILLLAIRPDGRIAASDKLRYALAGSELVRLAAARRVDVVEGRIIVLDARPTGDVNLDAALESIVERRKPPAAKSWVGTPRRRIEEAYQSQLEVAGVIWADRRTVFFGLAMVTRWAVLDVARVAELRNRLDAIAYSAGPVDSAQAAFGGLVHAIGLDAVLYPGRAGKAARERLKAVARKERTAGMVRSAVDGAVRASTDSAVSSSIDAATWAATDAAIDASVQAATDAAIAASIDAAVSASIDAAIDASVHAASSHGGHDGGGGGGHH